MTETVSLALAGRTATTRHFLMCRPDHFEVSYAINPWMDPAEGADRERAIEQWEALRAAYVRLGHQVSLIDPVDGLPDMVFAANGGPGGGRPGLRLPLHARRSRGRGPRLSGLVPAQRLHRRTRTRAHQRG